MTLVPSRKTVLSTQTLSGWGRFPRRDCTVAAPRRQEDWIDAVAGARVPVIARGAGRAYGDSALGTGLTLSTRHFDRMLDFDPVSGVLTVEAGVILGDIVETFLPRGWFPPVSPGTRHVTIGGMIAANVHGKNHHHAGSFGRHVLWLDLLGADGTLTRCTPSDHAALFRATLGGMGLTGVILRAAFRMIPVRTAWLRQERVLAKDLDAALAALAHGDGWTYSVAWIDCLAAGQGLGRSVLYRADHAGPSDLEPDKAAKPFSIPSRPVLRVPFDGPSWMLRGLTMRSFNALYYRRAAMAPREQILDWSRFFYPLDGVKDWNRLYGQRGFVQFQCVLPMATAETGLRAILERTAQAGQGSFLAVLKTFGTFDEDTDGLSFPAPGLTLALDFPANPGTLTLLQALDRVVLDHGGRFYLAKDARMTRETFGEAEMDRMPRFQALRELSGASGRFQSVQSARLGL